MYLQHVVSDNECKKQVIMQLISYVNMDQVYLVLADDL